MKTALSRRTVYFSAAMLIFVLEVAIARGLFGMGFVRGSVGDILVIMLMYALLRGVALRPPASTALLATAIGFCVEALQYIHFANLIGLKPGSVMAIVIGNTFSVADLLMYCIGGALAFLIDAKLHLPQAKR